MRRKCWLPTELSPRSSPNTCCSRDRPETRGRCRLCTRPDAAPPARERPRPRCATCAGALDAAGPADPPPEVLVDLCLAEASAGEATSIARFAQALQHIREPGQRADALYSLGQTLYRFGRYADAGKVFRQGAALFEDGDRQVRLRFEAAAFGAEYHLPPEQHGPLSAADGTGPGDRAVLAVHALRKCLMSPPASAGADMAIRALRGRGAARRAHLAKSRRQPRRPCAAAFGSSGRGTRGRRCGGG